MGGARTWQRYRDIYGHPCRRRTTCESLLDCHSAALLGDYFDPAYNGLRERISSMRLGFGAKG